MEAEADKDDLFEDPDFPVGDSALFSDYSTPLSRLLGQVTWLRPQEICETPTLFPENPAEGHAKQGILGDCWFLCACTMLLRNRYLMDKVLPPDQPWWGESGYRGDVLVRFWQNGHWTDVRVDDRLPCVANKLCFSHCVSHDAFWVALLEKAYAKLRGSYERLWAGQVCEALVDLSGGLAERWSLKAEEQQHVNSDVADALTGRRLDFKLLPHMLKERYTISCSVHSSPTGASELGQYHALNVLEWTDVRTQAGEEVRLLRIRNPWGRRCWGGAWTDSGPGWSTLDPACAMDLLGRIDQGEFWVEEAEFLSEFDEVTVGYPINDEGHLQSIYTGTVLSHTHQIGGCWVTGQSAGGCRNSSSYGNNPKYWLRVREAGEVLVSLQQCRKYFTERSYTVQSPGGSSQQPSQHHAIAIHMWKVDGKRVNVTRTLSKTPCASTHCHAYEREVVLHTHLSAGFYLLIPSTFQQGAAGSFLLRLHSSSSASFSAVRAAVPSLPSVTDGEWETTHSQGSWIPGSSAGGGRNFPSHGENPRIPLTVTYDPGGTNVRVTLRQSGPDSDLHAIGFHIYTAVESSSVCDSEPVVSCVPHCYSREVCVSCTLSPGQYIIIPSTYQPNLRTSFNLTVQRRIYRKVVNSQERLGQAIQEVSNVSVMRC